MAKGTKEKEQVTQEDIIKKFTEAPLPIPTEEVKEEITDTVVLSNKRKLKLAPTKLRYFKTGDYGMYKLIEQIGVADILGYSDGFDIICKFLSAVFDKPYKIEDVKDENGEYTARSKKILSQILRNISNRAWRNQLCLLLTTSSMKNLDYHLKHQNIASNFVQN